MIGSGLYSLGGFLLPFVVVGSVGIVLAICLFFAIPKGEYENRKDQNESNTKKLTWAGVFKVCADTYNVVNKSSFEFNSLVQNLILECH